MKDAPETEPNRSGTRYSAADKLKAVKLYFEEGYQAKDIARELGIGKSSLGKWIREYREKGSGAFTSPPEKSAAAAEKSSTIFLFSRKILSTSKWRIFQIPQDELFSLSRKILREKLELHSASKRV